MAEQNIKLTDGLWLYRRTGSPFWQVKGKGPDGAWSVRFSTGEEDADKAKVIAFQKYYGKVQEQEARAPKFKEASKLYIAKLDAQAKEKGPNVKNAIATHRTYRINVHRWIDPFFENKHLDAIDEDTIQEWHQWRTEEREGKRHSQSTVNHMIIPLRQILNIAKRKKWISALPEIKNTGEQAVPRPAFEPEEMAKLYEVLNSGWIDDQNITQRGRDLRRMLRWYVLLLDNSGMRSGGEVEGLQWRHVNLDHQSHGIYFPLLKITKGKMAARNKPRDIVIAPDMRQHLMDLGKFTKRTNPDDFVFILPDGYQPESWSYVFNDLREACGLTFDAEGNKRTLYSIRHTFITRKLLDKMPIHDLATHCGTSHEMIQEYYSKLRSKMIAHDLYLEKVTVDPRVLFGAHVMKAPDSMIAKTYAFSTKLEPKE